MRYTMAMETYQEPVIVQDNIVIAEFHDKAYRNNLPLLLEAMAAYLREYVPERAGMVWDIAITDTSGSEHGDITWTGRLYIHFYSDKE